LYRLCPDVIIPYMRGHIDTLIKDLEKGAIALTVNRRLSRHIVNSFDSVMKGRGLKFWQSPTVAPLSAWIDGLLEKAPLTLPILDAARSRALWESIVEKDGHSAETARLSFEAMTLMNEYALELPEDLYLTEEARALKGWMKAYEVGLKKLGFIGPEKKTALAVKALKAGSIEAPVSIVLAGFDEITPAARVLIDELKRRGAKISFWPDNGGPAAPLDTARVTVRPYTDETEEVVQAARWARANSGSSLRIGFIVPEIERYRSLIMREFAHELDPASVLDAHAGRVFNISLGYPLSIEPIVSAALKILSVTMGPEELTDIFGALLTPYLAADEGYALTRLEARLRKENASKTSLNEIRKRLRGRGRAQAIIDAWIGELKESRKELPSAWAGRFSKMLTRLGFPAQTLTSREYQAVKAWTGLLGAFSSLDCVTGRLTRGEAAARLKKLANDTVHQSETPGSDRLCIQVMGLLEAAGQEFDRVWIMGCHEGAMPATPQPNPFIPISIQKKAGLPRSSPEKELAFARSALARLVEGAGDVIVSFPRTSEDRTLGVSPFFRAITPLADVYIAKSSCLKDAVNGAACVVEAPPDAELPVGAEELKGIRGGTNIIKNQSLCPFRAFAAHRLSARPVPEPEFGLTPIQRGDAVHTALKAFWSSVRDSERLKALINDNAIDAEIDKAVHAAFADLVLPPPLSTRFIAIEKEILKGLLRDWIEVEAGRVKFTVESIEDRRAIMIRSLTIEGKPDRIDRLEDGRTVCIDYKTGSMVDRKDWLTDRPRDPQLMIYTVDGGFDALAFARLTPGECGFIGTARSAGTLPDVLAFEEDKRWKEGFDVHDWVALIDFWKRSIEALAGEFLGGVARVDPTGDGRELACETCDFMGLCRVTEAEET